MASFVRQGILALFFAMALFSISCEKHPIGQLPDVQREQPDPAKEWSEAPRRDSYESSSRPQPPESPRQPR
jgi:hypothetical protein